MNSHQLKLVLKKTLQSLDDMNDEDLLKSYQFAMLMINSKNTDRKMIEYLFRGWVMTMVSEGKF